MIRAAIGELKQESNSFSPFSTTLASFEDGYLLYAQEVISRLRGTNSELAGFIAAPDIEVVPTLAAWSLSGGPLTRQTFELLKGELLGRIQAAGPIDGILLSLHGAMLVDGIDDPDGLLLAELRAQTRPDVPIVATLDLHANMTQRMVESASALVPYRTYPHVDQRETGARAAQLLLQIVQRGLRPVTALEKLPLLVPSENQQLTHGPMADLMQQADALEAEPGIVSAALLPVQPWLDVPELGFGVLVTADGDRALARREARALAARVWHMRRTFDVELVPVDEAIARALREPVGPVVLGDSADSTGSGSAGDSTAILDALLHAPLRGPALLTMVDPEAVSAACGAGVGARVTMPLGGKIDYVYNRPVQVAAQVLRLVDDGRFRFTGPAFTGLEADMGRAAVLEAGQVKILITERRVWTIDPELYRAAGLEPAAAQIVVVKSPNAFRAAYEPIAARIIMVDGPGASTSNYSRLPFSRIPRPMYPLDAMEDGDWPPAEEQSSTPWP